MSTKSKSNFCGVCGIALELVQGQVVVLEIHLVSLELVQELVVHSVLLIDFHFVVYKQDLSQQMEASTLDKDIQDIQCPVYKKRSIKTL